MSTSVKILLGVVGGAVLVLVVLPVFFATSGLFGSGSMMGDGSMMDQGGMMGDGGMMGGGWGIFGIIGMLFPLLLFVGLIAVIVWAVVRVTANRPGGGAEPRAGGNSAEEVLRQRFARGEIDAQEYEERHRVLREKSTAAHR